MGSDLDKDTSIELRCIAMVPEKSHYSHWTGFHVSIAGGIKVKFTVDMIALKSHPTELKNALQRIVCTTCKEMTLITDSKLMVNEGHSKINENQKRHGDVVCEPQRKKRCMSKCNKCCTM